MFTRVVLTIQNVDETSDQDKQGFLDNCSTV